MRHFVELDRDVWVATSRRDLAITTVLVSSGSALLIDPSWDPDELADTAAWLRDRNLTVTAGFATHAHHDHVLWHPEFGAVPRWASIVTADRARQHRTALVAELGPGWPTELTDLVGMLTPTDEPVLPWPNRVELVRHDAHTPGHTALWLPGAQILIAGDMLSDVEPPLPEETGPAEYLAGLHVLRRYAEAARLVVPGHGTPGSDAADRWHRDAAQVAAMLRSASAADLDDGFDLDR